jgi:hypothetical protein
MLLKVVPQEYPKLIHIEVAILKGGYVDVRNNDVFFFSTSCKLWHYYFN